MLGSSFAAQILSKHYSRHRLNGWTATRRRGKVKMTVDEPAVVSGWLLCSTPPPGSRLLILGGEPLMGESQHLARETTPPTVIRLPAEIDATNAGRIGEVLYSAFAPGVAAVIADMTDTTFCDSSGARELLLAHHKATADGDAVSRCPAHLPADRTRPGTGDLPEPGGGEG
jgi:hypothetical protein